MEEPTVTSFWVSGKRDVEGTFREGERAPLEWALVPLQVGVWGKKTSGEGE